ncbi:inversin-like, partial [Plectropomus leopardus]|uniref:inversin-like n=1 Tax=Plectropomus leopardus TaxID=160734 RepID=UPI001C4A89B2
HKSRSSRRSKAPEPNELPDASNLPSHVTGDTVPGAPQTTRLKELLSPASCSQPPSLKPRPPSMPKVRERPSSNTCAPTGVTAIDQTDTVTRECGSHKKRDTHLTLQTAPGKTDAHNAPQKHRNHKEQTSERTATKDQTPSSGSSSSLDHKSPSRKTLSATHAPISTRMHGEHHKEQRRRRNEAARIIQRAWRRFHARRRREIPVREEAAPSDSHHAHTRKKTELRAQPTKLLASKSSVLQSIYGEIIAF